MGAVPPEEQYGPEYPSGKARLDFPQNVANVAHLQPAHLRGLQLPIKNINICFDLAYAGVPVKSALQLTRELEQRQSPTRRSPRKPQSVSKQAFPPGFNFGRSKGRLAVAEIKPKPGWWLRYSTAHKVGDYVEIDMREWLGMPPYSKKSRGI